MTDADDRDRSDDDGPASDHVGLTSTNASYRPLPPPQSVGSSSVRTLTERRLPSASMNPPNGIQATPRPDAVGDPADGPHFTAPVPHGHVVPAGDATCSRVFRVNLE